jgi:p-aminobenzoyl-glutamate transporter AbgT
MVTDRGGHTTCAAAPVLAFAAVMFIAWSALFFGWWALDIFFGFGGTGQ